MVGPSVFGELCYENCFLRTSRMYLIQTKMTTTPWRSSGHAGGALHRRGDGAAEASLQQARCQLRHLWVG